MQTTPALDILEEQTKAKLVNWAEMSGWMGSIHEHERLLLQDKQARDTLDMIKVARMELDPAHTKTKPASGDGAA